MTLNSLQAFSLYLARTNFSFGLWDLRIHIECTNTLFVIYHYILKLVQFKVMLKKLNIASTKEFLKTINFYKSTMVKGI